MALSDITVARRTFKYNGADFRVRGLSFNDVSRVILDYESEVEQAINLIDQARDKDGEVNPAAAISLLIQQAPSLAAKLVAAAADEPGAWENVLNLPVTTQMEVFMAVGELTFTEPDSVKKFAANLAILIAKIKTIKSS